jgi:4-aminobutyrate aminotransferase
MMNLIDELSSLEVSQRAGLDSWFFWNSGSEAVEAAIKLARQVNERRIQSIGGGMSGCSRNGCVGM